LSLDFSKGLHVLTGETGAGKSIWIDAMALALGERADVSVIRQGQQRCDISLIFNIAAIPQAQAWLQEHQLESEHTPFECLIRRTISVNTTSRSTINGVLCPLHLVRQLSEILLTIHGQHDQHHLLSNDGQQQQLDRFAKNNVHLQEIQTGYGKWQNLEKEIASGQAVLNNRHTELELIQFQSAELEHLNLQESEWEELSKQHRHMHNANQWQTQIQTVHNLIGENEQSAAINQVYQALNLLNTIKSDDAKLQNAKNLLKDSAVLIEESSSELNSALSAMQFDPQKLSEIEQRLNKIHDIARKHRVNPPELFSVQQKLLQKIQGLENAEKTLENLKNKQQEIIAQFQKIAEQLTIRREKAIKKVNKEMTTWMQQLGMMGGFFDIKLEKIDQPIHPLGHEKISFFVSTNPGQDPQPLNKIASGGELSRLHLALQVIIAEQNHTPTLVFDEVDVGIGGPTALVVGKLLRELSEKTQVLCITHLPQVAAYGHHHFCVMKIVKENRSTSSIILLTDSERAEELARMLGGANLTSQILTHAQEMLTLIK
jgi:DNA repair protein RecN (Recombination protein N)